ncbi:MAG: PrgI family protein [Patescibacteria group bacterium]|jgi:hypothetical protein
MQQFTVPQFIDVEPKIIGPITTRQFLIFLGSALLVFICYKIFFFTTFVIVSVLIIALAGTFAFLKINGRAFHYFILNLIQTLKRPALRIWNHKSVVWGNNEDEEVKYEKIITADKYFSKEKLAELSLIIDTKGRYRGADGDNIEVEESYS